MTNNEIATTGQSAEVGIWSPGQASDFTPRQREDMRALQPGLDKASDADLRKLFTVSKQADLNPYMKEVYLVGRWSREGTVWATQTSIDGFRKVTHRYAESKGLPVNISAPIFYDADGNKRPFWSKKFGDHPEAAEVTVSVGDSSATVINAYDEYVQTKKDGTPNSMWAKMGATMLAKTSEAAAHRRVCPITAGLYVEEEMRQDDSPVQATAEPVNASGTTVVDAVPELAPGDALDAVAAVIRSVTTVDELNELVDGLIKPHLEGYPDDRDAVMDVFTEKKEELHG